MKHIVTFHDWQDSELRDMLELAHAVKASPEVYRRSLEDRSLIMIFQKTSTRTRISFELGMCELGGIAVFLDWRTTNIPISDLRLEAQYLSRNCSVIMARMLRHDDMRAFAASSNVPVINGLDEKFHPTQLISDFFTLEEKLGSLKDRTVVYVGVHNNVANSLMVVGCKLGVNIVLVTPTRNDASYDSELVQWAESTGHFRVSTDMRTELQNTDAVYVDTWVDMEFYNEEKYQDDRSRRETLMMPYQLTPSVMEGSEAVILHAMPIHVDYEIARELVHDPRSIILQQAENLRHMRKAILLTLIGHADVPGEAPSKP